MTYWAIAGLSHAVLYYRESRDRALRASQLETRLVEAQMAALQQQLQPHFLFNTLHAISALMHRDVEAADRTLMRLSDLLRMTLENLGRQEITLQGRARLPLQVPRDRADALRRSARRPVRRRSRRRSTRSVPTLLAAAARRERHQARHLEEERAGAHRRHPRPPRSRQAVDRGARRRRRAVGDGAGRAAEGHRRLDDARAAAASVRRGLPVRVPPPRRKGLAVVVAVPWRTETCPVPKTKARRAPTIASGARARSARSARQGPAREQPAGGAA